MIYIHVQNLNINASKDAKLIRDAKNHAKVYLDMQKLSNIIAKLPINAKISASIAKMFAN
jgi:hypothetical protein